MCTTPDRAERFACTVGRVDVALALDIGGTKLAAGLVTAAGELLTSAAAPTPAGGDAEAVFDAVLTLLDSVGPTERNDSPSGPTERNGSPSGPVERRAPGWWSAAWVAEGR